MVLCATGYGLVCHWLWTCVPLAMVLCATGYASALLAAGLQLGFKRDNFAKEMFDAGRQVQEAG